MEVVGFGLQTLHGVSSYVQCTPSASSQQLQSEELRGSLSLEQNPTYRKPGHLTTRKSSHFTNRKSHKYEKGRNVVVPVCSITVNA